MSSVMGSAIDMVQLRDLVIRPALTALDLWSPAAEELLMGTILQESQGGHWLRQTGGGPALGICQMEPVTHDDIWRNFLAYHPDLAIKVKGLMVRTVSDIEEMVGNLYYAVAMARVLYYRVAEPLPKAGDISAQAAYYKAHYNTAGGAASEAQYLVHWAAVFPH